MTFEEVMTLIDQYVRVEVQEANAHPDAPTEQTAMRRDLAMTLKTLLDDNALLGKTEQLLRKQIGAANVLIAGLERRAIAHGKERDELARQAADVAGEREANAELTAELERQPYGVRLPNPGSPEAGAMIDSVLAEYGWPANPKNAARAGYVAAQRLMGPNR